jgi:3-isopropylmalate dehydrogenase
MMFRYSLDAPQAALAVERAVDAVLDGGFRTADIMPSDADADLQLVGTRAMGDLVLEQMEQAEK